MLITLPSEALAGDRDLATVDSSGLLASWDTCVISKTGNVFVFVRSLLKLDVLEMEGGAGGQISGRGD